MYHFCLFFCHFLIFFSIPPYNKSPIPLSTAKIKSFLFIIISPPSPFITGFLAIYKKTVPNQRYNNSVESARSGWRLGSTRKLHACRTEIKQREEGWPAQTLPRANGTLGVHQMLVFRFSFEGRYIVVLFFSRLLLLDAKLISLGTGSLTTSCRCIFLTYFFLCGQKDIFISTFNYFLYRNIMNK